MGRWSNPLWAQQLLSRRRRGGSWQTETASASAEGTDSMSRSSSRYGPSSGGLPGYGGPSRMPDLDVALAALEEGFSAAPMPVSVEELTSILQRCGQDRNSACASRLHGYMRQTRLETHPSLGNCLVSMLVEVGSISDAHELFDRLSYRDKCSWDSLIMGYIRCGNMDCAFSLYEKMSQDDAACPTRSTVLALLKACSDTGDLDRGCKIHAHVAAKGLLETDRFVSSALISMYAKSGSLAKAWELFDQLSFHNVVLWNVLISGYAQHGHAEEALNCYEEMRIEGVSPDAITFVCILKACGSIGAIDKGQEIHAEIARKELLAEDIFLGNGLVDMYAKCGLLTKAQEVFNELPVRDIVSWNVLISGYIQQDCGEEALNCVEHMRLLGFHPSKVTFLCSLKACGSMRATGKGEEIHAEIVTKGLFERDVSVGNTLVDFYAKCGLIAEAQKVFTKLPGRNVVSWTALLGGYLQHGCDEEALNCFGQMQVEGLSPDSVAFVCLLKACGSVGAIDKGQEIHGEICRKGLLEKNMVIGTALVDMYAKCGLLRKAQDVFDKLLVRNVTSWNALIAGYADLGEIGNVFHVFKEMTREGLRPDLATFTSLLNACSKTGLVEACQILFSRMSTDDGIMPTIEHYTCMVNLLGRAGQFHKALMLIKMMPFRADVVVWQTFMASLPEVVQFGAWKASTIG